MQKIIRSIARCKICDDIIESKHTHDYIRCKCGAIFLDVVKSIKDMDGCLKKYKEEVMMK